MDRKAGRPPWETGPAPEAPGAIGSDEWIRHKLGGLEARAASARERGLQGRGDPEAIPDYLRRPAPRSLDDMIGAGGIRQRIFPNLHHGTLGSVDAVVLHRTDGYTAESTLSNYRGDPKGAHFLIDNDGTISQTADTGQQAWHVGLVRSRAESRKPYPSRYLTNSNSIGIEVVGKYDVKAKAFATPTRQQLESLRTLVEVLKLQYGLDEEDIYRHGIISYKDENRTEGSGLGY